MSGSGLLPEGVVMIGVRLRATRLALGLSTTEFHSKVQFSKTQLENFEAGRRLMKPDVAVRVIRAFPSAKLDFNWLYHGDLAGVAHEFALKVQSVLPPILEAAKERAALVKPAKSSNGAATRKPARLKRAGPAERSAS